MFSNIFLSKSKLLYNIATLSHIAGKEICVMVKANAYGHGAKQIVEILKDEVNCFGVSNQTEALELREITDKKIIVFGRCEDYKTCIEKDISFSLYSLSHLKEIIKISKKIEKSPRLELCINSGMNRYGVRDIKEFKKIIEKLEKYNLFLQGIFTHFSSLTTDEEYTKRQYKIFQEFVSLLPNKWNTIKHVGGGRSIFENFDVDMFRIGLEVYGYGNEDVKPCLSVQSKVVNILNVKKGEHIGYLCGYTAERDMKVATIPLGYGDGLPRLLSNKLTIEIKGQEVKNVGNICMDAFMIDVSNINCKIGDKVVIFDNASEIAPLIQSTEYEVLTNLSKFRGERKIIE